MDIAQVWGAWKEELPSVGKIDIPRFLLQGLSSIAKVEIHGFADSSQKAYGSVIYLCAENENKVSNCCVPTSLYSMSLMYSELVGSLVLREYSGMVVSTCGCR